MRTIRQLALALARIAGLRKSALLDDASRELDAAMASLGGVDPRLVERTDAGMLAVLVGDPVRREALSRLLEEQAEIAAARGDGVRADATRAKARALAPGSGGTA